MEYVGWMFIEHPFLEHGKNFGRKPSWKAVNWKTKKEREGDIKTDLTEAEP